MSEGKGKFWSFSITDFALAVIACLNLGLLCINFYLLYQQHKFQSSTNELDLYKKVNELNQVHYNFTATTAERQSYLYSVKSSDMTRAMMDELGAYITTANSILRDKHDLLNGICILYKENLLDEDRFKVMLLPTIINTQVSEDDHPDLHEIQMRHNKNIPTPKRKNNLLDNMSKIANIFIAIGVIVAFLGLHLQRKIFRADHERRKKQSTVEFYHAIFTPEIRKLWDDIEKEFKVNNDKCWKIDPDKVYGDANASIHETVKSYFVFVDRFSVGVNIEAYDIYIANLICGESLIERFERAEDYIVRSRKGRPSNYEDFVLLVKNLTQIRKKLSSEEQRKRANIKEEFKVY